MRCLFVLSLCLPLLIRANAIADELSAQQLIELAPKFSFDDRDMRTLRFAGTLTAGYANVVFDLAYQLPGRYALRVSDGKDGTPILLAADGRLLIYDAAERQVVVSAKDRVAIDFVAAVKGDELKLAWGLDTRENARNTADIDLKPLVVGLNGPKAHREADGTFTLTGRTKTQTSTVTARVDPAKKCPYTRMDCITVKGDVQIHFTEVSRDEAIPPARWRFPLVDALRRRLLVVNWDDLSETGVKNAIAAAMGLSFAYRAAIGHPDVRPDWEREHGPVDWDRARQEDAAFSAEIRSLVTDSQKPPTSAPAPTTTRSTSR